MDPSRPLQLSVEGNSPLLLLVLSDLLALATYAHQPPEVARLVQDLPSNSNPPVISVDFVPYGLSSQALAIRVYRSCFHDNRAQVDLPLSLHADFLKVRGHVQWEGLGGWLFVSE